MSKRPLSPSSVFDESLGLSSEHALSLSLAKEVAELNAAPPNGVVSALVVSLGLVELELRAGSLEGYGRRPWRVRVGGAGIGDEVC